MKNIHHILLVVFMIILSSCNSTYIVSNWRDPDRQIHSSVWKKVLVLAMLRNETERHSAEDQMVRYLDGKGITSYSYLDENFDHKNEQALRQKIKKDGFDAAITMRLIDVDKEKIYKPAEYYMYPMYYDDFVKYYYRNWMYYNIPGYYTITKKFIIETIIYSIRDDKIIWSGITATYDPDGVKRLTSEIAHVIRCRMEQEGFIEN